MKKIKIDKTYELEDFENYCHLWNLNGLSGEGITLLRKIVDSIHSNNYLCPGKRFPSALILGDGRLLAKAYINSLQIEEVRECSGIHLENGYNSSLFFNSSIIPTAYLIIDVDQLTKYGESVLWRYMREGRCTYYNYMTNMIDRTVYCNGLIILTAKDAQRVAPSILKEVDHTVVIEPFSAENLKELIHQILQFCGVVYENRVIDEIVKIHPLNMDAVLHLLRNCITLIRAELADCLTLETVKKAKMLTYGIYPPFGEGIPF